MDLPQSLSTNVARVAELIRGVPICMLTTILGDGVPRARPMIAQEQPFDGSLWFVVERDSEVAHEIRRNPIVGVTYDDPAANRYVSVAGRARIVEDRAILAVVWRAPMEAWFPRGALDPGLALIEVRPSQAWFWAGAPEGAGRIVGLARAVVTGEGGLPDPGSSGHLRL